MKNRIKALENIYKICIKKLVVVIGRLDGTYSYSDFKENVTPEELKIIKNDPNTKLVVIRPASRWRKWKIELSD